MSNEEQRGRLNQTRFGAVEALAGYALAGGFAYLAWRDIDQFGWLGVVVVFGCLLLIWDGLRRFNSGWSLDG